MLPGLSQAPVTGMLPFGGMKRRKKKQKKKNSLIVCSATSPQGPCIVAVSTASILHTASPFCGEPMGTEFGCKIGEVGGEVF